MFSADMNCAATRFSCVGGTLDGETCLPDDDVEGRELNVTAAGKLCLTCTRFVRAMTDADMA
eukprot:3940672-Rhodomonas_salina.2